MIFLSLPIIIFVISHHQFETISLVNNTNSLLSLYFQTCMQVGDQQLGIGIVIVFLILLIALIGNILLFLRGHQSYSVKYEIYLNSQFFRHHPKLCETVQVIYHIFFAVPFALLIVIAVMRALVQPIEFLTIMVNGLIVLLTIYPTKTQFYYIKLAAIWVLAVVSQLNTLFLHMKGNQTDVYTQLCSIFYPINCILFALAILAHEQDYWELHQAIGQCEEELKAIRPEFAQLKEGAATGTAEERAEAYAGQGKNVVKQYNIPFIFDGGLYGSLCRYKGNRGLKRGIMYGLSLVILGLNAYLVWLGSGTSLGVIGLITNFIYDIFIMAFSSLKTSQRSVRNIFFLIFLGRFMSFVFGTQLWLFGYCVLYFIVGVFVGRIIINRRLPLRAEKKSKLERHKRQEQNALKTPQFVLFVLTAEVFLLVLASSFGVGVSGASYSYSATVSIPLWQFAVIAVIATWVIILFLASVRMFAREKSNIRDNLEYYFGLVGIREFHVYMLVTYGLVVGLGLYCYFFILESTAFFSSLFLPIILVLLMKLEHEWVKNEYQILADIKEYNERVSKARKTIEKKRKALDNQQVRKVASLKDTDKLMVRSGSGRNLAFENSGTGLIVMDQNDNSETSTQMEQQNAIKQELRKLDEEYMEQVEIEYNWRTFEGRIGVQQFFFKFLTSSDRWILCLIVAIGVLSVAYAVITYFVAGTIFGILIILGLLALLSMSPFYRYSRTLKELQWPQHVWFYFGWVTGLIYWGFYRSYTTYAVVWSGWHILCTAGVLSLGLARGIKKQCIYQLLASITLTAVYICAMLFATVSSLAATIVTVVIVMLAIGAVPIAYNQLEGSTPKVVKGVCGSIIVVGVVGTAILGKVSGFASNFAIFSFVMGSLYVVMFVVASILFYERESNKYATPHVYSAYGVPVYKFESGEQKLKSSVSHKVVYEWSGMVVVIYSAIVTLIFDQKEFAVMALGYFCVVTFLSEMLFAIKTHNQLAELREYVTPELVGRALRDLNGKYMVDFKLSASSRGVDEQKKKLKGEAQAVNEEERLNSVYSALARKHQEWVNACEEEQKFLFFWIVLIEFNVFTDRKAEMLRVVIQAKEIETQLMDYGIYLQSINYPITDFAAKYELVVKEIDELHPFDFINYQDLLAKHQALSRERSQEQRKKAIAEEEEHRKREQEVFDQLQAQSNKSGDQRITEFNDMLAAIEPKKKYTDPEFAADESTLGSLSTFAEKWRRPRRGETLVKGEINGYDVKQGNIGDCYLISSMGVLGDGWIRSALGMVEAEGWRNQKGAYMVRFFKFLKKVYVIVDDQLPVDNHDDFVFARSQDPEEIWPCILEKAYAKLYGGYHRIVQGKCHRVFAEFTGGFPSELNLEEYKSNPHSLWERITTARDNKYLMAAGSPSHADGDRAHSARGIVQGHAYSILSAREVEGHRLLELKNPHGSGGIQWSGDFSDGSELMSKRLMQLLGHENKDDGVFWMSIQDFIQQYKSLYLCAIFDDSWLKVPPISGRFTQQNSFGLPTSSDQTFRNPQFGIRVTKKCSFFVNMIQQAQSSIKGVNTIYLRIQKNEGKRISKHNVKSDLLCGRQLRPINSITLSNEAVLEADSYPYVFTVYISCESEGDEGDYVLEMYCNDKEMTVIGDKEFDRELFS